ncbi:MAG: hypothetical protein ACR2LE_02585 [Nocardioidaceae bacterium]
MEVLGVHVSQPLLAKWCDWLAPAVQPFFLPRPFPMELPAEKPAAATTRTPDLLSRPVGRPDALYDTYEAYNLDTGLDTVWLDELAFGSLPKHTRAQLVRAQVDHGRGAVPTVRAWSGLLDHRVLRAQADGHRFVWWPSLVTGDREQILSRVVSKDRESSRHGEVPDQVWRACASTLPGARELAATFAVGSGANCFATVMAAAGVAAAADTWMQQEPFDSWLAQSTTPGGDDRAPGTVLLWRDKHGVAQHAAVTIGGGWGLEKPSQAWSTPRAVLRVTDIIRTTRTPGRRLQRHAL